MATSFRTAENREGVVYNPADLKTLYAEDFAAVTGAINDLEEENDAGRGLGASTLLVAAATASAKIKARADYICTGTNDQEIIQAAIDSLGAAGGTVLLSDGNFFVKKNSQSVAKGATTGVAGLQTYLTDYSKLDVGALYNDISVGDDISVRDGASQQHSSNTLQQRHADGIYAVMEKLGAPYVKLLANINDTYDSVVWVRPQWAIKVPPLVTLKGTGRLSTKIVLADNENCSVIFLSAPTYTQGAQSLVNFSVMAGGAYPPTQSGDAWLNNGILTGGSYDVDIIDVEIRYFKGTGVVISQPWGFSQSGAWVEDCAFGFAVNGGGRGPRLHNIKIQQCPSGAIIFSDTGASITNCEIASAAGDGLAMIIRGGANRVLFNGCSLEATTEGYKLIDILSMDGGLTVCPIIVGCRMTLTATGNLIRNNGNYVYGGIIIGTLDAGVATTSLFDYPGCMVGLKMELAGRTYSQLSAPLAMNCVTVLNGVGSSMAEGKAYAWKSAGTIDEVVAIGSDNDALFAGVCQQLPIPNATLGPLVTSGYTLVYVDATGTAIAIGDPLCIKVANPGAFYKAGSGDTVYAIARQVKASGVGTIKAQLVAPRRIP